MLLIRLLLIFGCVNSLVVLFVLILLLYNNCKLLVILVLNFVKWVCIKVCVFWVCCGEVVMFVLMV